jgi:hypothetical protein
MVMKVKVQIYFVMIKFFYLHCYIVKLASFVLHDYNQIAHVGHGQSYMSQSTFP